MTTADLTETVEAAARDAAYLLADEVWGDEPSALELELMEGVITSDWLKDTLAEAKREALLEAADATDDKATANERLASPGYVDHTWRAYAVWLRERAALDTADPEGGA